MKIVSLPEPWRSLAREWAPRFLAAWGPDGLLTPAGVIRLLAIPDAPQLVDGAAQIIIGPLVISCANPHLIAMLSRATILVGANYIRFPDPWPEVSGVPGGVRFHWREPAIVESVGAKIWGVTMPEVCLYPDHAVVKLTNWRDIKLIF